MFRSYDGHHSPVREALLAWHDVGPVRGSRDPKRRLALCDGLEDIWSSGGALSVSHYLSFGLFAVFVTAICVMRIRDELQRWAHRRRYGQFVQGFRRQPNP